MFAWQSIFLTVPFSHATADQFRPRDSHSRQDKDHHHEDDDSEECPITHPEIPPCAVSFFGPQKYFRTKGPKDVYTTTLTVPGWVIPPYRLHIQNGAEGGSNRVSSASVKVNGVEVAKESDFNQKVPSLDRVVNLTPQTTLKVTLAGKPDSYLVIDACGQSGDRTPPQITITSPVPNSFINNATPRMTVRYQDIAGNGESVASGVDPATLRVLLDGIDRTALFTKGPQEAIAVLPVDMALPDGRHHLHATMMDKAGNITNSNAAEEVFTVDTIPPTIQASLSPAANAAGWNNRDVTVSFLCADDRSGIAGCRPSFQTISSEGGQQTVIGMAIDMAGNTTSTSVVINLDKTPPSVIVASPGDGDTVTAAPVLLSGTVTDALSGVAEMTCNGHPSSLSGADFTCSLPLIEGANVIDLEARDAAGNAKAFPRHVIYTPNRPPAVNAGSDQTIALPNSASLSGTVSDDGLPAGSALSLTWSAVSGPGAVTFGDPNALSTSADFSAPGVYVIRLTVSDSQLTSFDDVVVTVNGAVCGSGATGIPESYSITDMGVAASTSGQGYHFITGINDLGQVVGGFFTDTGAIHAFLWLPAAAYGLPPGLNDIGIQATNNQSYATAINDAGQVVIRDYGHSFVWNPNQGIQVLSPLPGKTDSNAYGINNLGQVVGESSTFSGDSHTHAVMWNPDGSVLDLGTLGGTYSSAARINDAGQVTGTSLPAGATSLPSQVHAFLWSSDQGMRDIGTLGGTQSGTQGINVLGHIVGDSAVTGNTAQHAIFYHGEMMLDLGTLGGVNSYAWSINSSDQFVGEAQIANGTYHAFLYSCENLTDLNNLIESGSGWVLTAARGINNLGQIIGYGTHNGQVRRYLLTPSTPGIVNQPPVVNAGSDQTIALPNSASLSGTVTDDGLLAGGTLSLVWSAVSGPGSVTFVSPDSAVTTAAFGAPGTYVLRFTASDSVLTGSDDISVIVHPALAVNQPPVVSAGADQAVAIAANLIVNPGNEAALVSGEIPGWIEETGTTWTHAPAETAQFPLPIEGSTYFFPSDTAASELRQDVDVSAFAAGIEAGTQHFDLSAYLRSANESPADVPELLIEFWDASRTQYLGGLTSGPTPSPNTWTPILGDVVPPAGTAWIRVWLLATRNTGTTNDAYFDGLSLRPHGNAAARLDGTVSDDGLPAGSAVTSAWSRVSGPAPAVAFAGVSQPQTSVSFTSPGTYVLQLSASDSQLTTNATTSVVVSPANQAPTVSAGAGQTIKLPAITTLNGTVADDGLPSGASLSFHWSRVDGPGNVSFANPDFKDTTAAFDAPGYYRLRLLVSDGDLFTNSTVDITVQPADAVNQSPTANAGPDQSVTLPGAVTLHYTVTDDGLPSGGTLTIEWSTLSGPSSAFFSAQTLDSIKAAFDQAGTYVLRLTVTDTQFTVTDDVTVTVTGTNTGGPMVSITAPLDGDTLEVSAAFTGTASDPNLADYTLAYSPSGENNFKVFATSQTSVINSELGVLDTTVLQNGFYDIRLTATDVNGFSSSITKPYIVQSDLKVGQFGFSQQDLVIPAAGLPLAIIRTYNSLNLGKGDFGFSWTYAIQDMNVRLNESREYLFDLISEETFSARSGGGRDILLTLPDGRRTTFKFNLVTESVFGTTIKQLAIWTPPPGVFDTLAPTVSNRLITEQSFGGAGFSYWEADPQIGNGEVYDFPSFILTTKDGTQYLLTREDLGVHQTQLSGSGPITVRAYGAMRLNRITDRSGNHVEIAADHIDHFDAGNVKTKSVIFQRDGQNRITAIYDPNGLDVSGNPAGPAAFTYEYDAAGNLARVNRLVSDSTVSPPVYETTQYLYQNPSFPHYITDIKDPRGITPLRSEFDAGGRLIATIDANGNRTELVHNVAGRTETIFDRLGNQTTHTYDDRGNVLTTIDSLGHVTQRQYDANNNLNLETDALGQTTTYTYDGRGNPVSVTDPLGNGTAFTYDSFGNLLTQTDPLGHTTQNTYDAKGNLVTMTDALGNTTTYTYDTNGNLIASVDPAGNTTASVYDAGGHLIQQTDALGHATLFTYDANGNKTSQTATRATDTGAETITTQYVYDGNNRLIKTIFPDGSITQTVYNNIGKQAATIDALGRQTIFEYDSRGNLVKTTYPDGTTDSSAYDAEGRRATSADKAGRVTAYHYDALGRLTQTTYPDGATVGIAYDAAGREISTMDSRGNQTSYAYDAAGRRVSVTDALGRQMTFAYDAAGNHTGMTDAKGHATNYVYDAGNRRTTVQFPDGTEQKTGYDALGRMIEKTDQAGQKTSYVYDALGRLIRVTDALGNVTSYTYDELGNHLTQTDANNHTTSFAYDALGRRIKRALPLGMFETYVYNAAGNLSQKIDFNGKTTTYGYDVMNRLIQKTPDASFGAPAVSFSYTPAGQRASMTDASGVTTYAYDNRDRLITKAASEGTLSYTYDAQGNLLSIRSSRAGGVSVDYTYDALNRPATVTDNHLSGGKVTAYTYDEVGNLDSYTYPNGVQSSYTYNALNRLTDMAMGKTAPLASYHYTLGPSGNRLFVTELSGRAVSYGYDAAYKLTQETIASDPNGVNGTIAYTYDPVGNRLARNSTVVPLANQTFTYDANDRLTSDGYDANGSTTSSGVTTYAYDFENRLISSNVGGGVTFLYDGDGNRVAKTASGVTTQYLVDDRNLTGYAQVMEEISGGAVQRHYTYGLDLISQNQASGVSFYGYDGHGNVRLLTDSTGNVMDTYDYDAFGNLIHQTGTTPNNFLYTGEQLDPIVGFYYLRARYMNSGTGRFISSDTFEGKRFDPVSLHKFLYANANPVMGIDPTGRFTLFDITLTLAINASFESVQRNYAGQLVRTLFDVNKIAQCWIAPASKLRNTALDLISDGGSDWAFDLYNLASQAQAQGYQILAKRIAQTYRDTLEGILNLKVVVPATLISNKIEVEINLADIAGLPDFSHDLEVFNKNFDKYAKNWVDLLERFDNIDQGDIASFLSENGGDYWDKAVSELLKFFGDQ